MNEPSFMSHVSPTMFPSLVPQVAAPDADTMARIADSVTKERKVAMKGLYVRTFDLSVPDDIAAYEKALPVILMGVALKTHAIIARPPLQYTEVGGTPRYIAHMQWIEYVLTEKEIEPCPSADEQTATRKSRKQ